MSRKRKHTRIEIRNVGTPDPRDLDMALNVLADILARALDAEEEEGEKRGSKHQSN